MAVNIVIMGALGRMGQSLRAAATLDAELDIVGLTETPERLAQEKERPEGISADLAEVLSKSGRAVLIDFTFPEVSLGAAKIAAKAGCPVVCGSTGLKPVQAAELKEIAQKIPYLLAPNMSVGVNLLLKLLPELVRGLGPAYDLEIMEIHHNKKKDAPSGTALKLAEALAEARGLNLDQTANYSRHGLIGQRPASEIGIQTIRGGDVVGVHTVFMLGPGERLEITHQAHSRETFAQGALRAAKWLNGQKPGQLYSMADALA